ncbi:hypothetical protein NUW54_g752 [Trametes sanguinea]|uniref:Uncharacterized protein n=1 Tax=Trametes sanguinea TaxID=158606 RepID=A0ACC1QB91_9APHY|nr:hypothetical protein NUW54_g752 [Trametes sanguinea]
MTPSLSRLISLRKQSSASRATTGMAMPFSFLRKIMFNNTPPTPRAPSPMSPLLGKSRPMTISGLRSILVDDDYPPKSPTVDPRALCAPTLSSEPAFRAGPTPFHHYSGISPPLATTEQTPSVAACERLRELAENLAYPEPEDIPDLVSNGRTPLEDELDELFSTPNELGGNGPLLAGTIDEDEEVLTKVTTLVPRLPSPGNPFAPPENLAPPPPPAPTPPPPPPSAPGPAADFTLQLATAIDMFAPMLQQAITPPQSRASK